MVTRRLASRTLTRLRHRAARAATALGALRPPPAEPTTLDRVRRRLELVLAATYGRTLHVEAAEGAPRKGVRDWLTREPRHLRSATPLASAAGDRVRLPASLDGAPHEAIARFRVLALEQGERLARDTAAHAPGDRLERDLYLLCEGLAVDAALLLRAHNAAPALADERARALAARPAMTRLTPMERAVEGMLRSALAAAPGDASAIPRAASPAQSSGWARAQADRLRAQLGANAAYRGVAPVALWGTVPESAMAEAARQGLVQEDTSRGQGGERAPDAPPANERGTPGRPDDTALGRGDRFEARGADATGAGGGPDRPPALDPVDDASRVAADPFTMDPAALEPGTFYPEWDCWVGRHRREGARVAERVAPPGDGAWATHVLEAHAALVRLVRHRFERLRARRARLGRQRDGDELDLDACVRAQAEVRAAGAASDDLYVSVRPARRALAVALLVDASGSTGEPITDAKRVIDVEREAVLLAAEALDALGDPYTVLAFSGRGARGVRAATLKGFDEPTNAMLRRRIGDLEPESNTRLGAALRHAAALLARQPAGHRLLLLLSDGKPNDADGYNDRYAVEDSRQAVHEARALGVVTHCLTVDREEHAYLAHVFGAPGYTILRKPEALPTALVGVVRQLLGRGA